MLFSLIELVVFFVLVAAAFGGIVAYFFYKTREGVGAEAVHKHKKDAGKPL